MLENAQIKSPALDGCIEYFHNETVMGWVQFSADCQGKLFLRVNKEQARQEVPLSEISRDGTLVRYRFSTQIPGADFGKIERSDIQVIAESDGRIKVLPLWGVLRTAYSISKMTPNQLGAVYRWAKLFNADFSNTPPSLSSDFSIKREMHFGHVSDDGDVVVGRNGHLFLGAGTNKVKEIYINDYPEHGKKWCKLFQSRYEHLNEKNVSYVQIVIPEKSSVLGHYCPFKTTNPSPLLAGLVSEVKRNQELRELVCFPFIDSEPADCYLLTDSHLSTSGAELIVNWFTRTIVGKQPIAKKEWDNFLLKGDLGSRFSGDVREKVRIIRNILFDEHSSDPVLVRSLPGTHGGNRGTTCVWNNIKAPFKVKVVAFGNSFFEKGNISTQLSWWFSRLFYEFHFIWSPELDTSYVDNVRPDIVVCQTIERFLRVIPTK